jgi:hypothetical protein
MAVSLGPAGAAAAAGTGSISGQITDAGTPIAGVTVSVVLPVYPVAVAQTTTDAAGAFHIDVAPGTYKLRFDLAGGLTQFFPQQTDFAAASELTVVDGEDTVVAEQVIPHGSVSGQITTSTAAVAAGAYVGLVQFSGVPVANVLAGRDGRYAFPFVAPGRYALTVGATPAGAPRQWAHGHKSRADADPITVSAGQASTVDERLLPLGVIRGTFTGAAGPIDGVGVLAESQTSAVESVSASTRADGTYTLRAYPGTYLVKYQVPGSLDQWADQKEARWRADVVTVVADTEIVLNQQALPTGRISGRLTDSAGNPVAAAGVAIADPLLDRQFQATTDEDGTWFKTVWLGTYQVSFETQTQVQWAFGKSSSDTATPVTVAANGDTTVNETLKIPGSMRITAKDAASGTPLTSFCVQTSGTMFAFACTDNGVAEFPEIGAGVYTVTVSDNDHLDSVTSGVQVTSGQASAVAARLQHGATITLDVADAATGTPIGSSVCVRGTLADRAPEPGGFLGDCVDDSGKVTLTRIKPGKYVFFASVFDGVHGAQWVGPHGGVGAQASARVVNVQYGDSAQVHVRLDGTGSIAGTVTDRRTGTPVAGAEVSAWGAGTATGDDGHYQLDGLGPYQWVLFFNHADHAGLWSGGGNNRLTATPVRVRQGQTTSYDIAMTAGTRLDVKVSGRAGQPPDFAQIQVVDADTFDILADVTTGSGGTYTAHVLGPQRVKLLVIATLDGLLHPYVWYPDAPDFAHGAVVQVPSSGRKTVNVVLD